MVKARIGIADAAREVEVEVAGRNDLIERLDTAYRDQVAFLWFKNSKGREIGIPLQRIAFVELVDDQDQAVGFGR